MYSLIYTIGLFVGLAVAQSTDTPVEKPTDVFLDKDRFILSRDDNYKLQRYVSTILDLNLKKKLCKETDDLRDLRAFQTQAKKNANHWYSTLFPKTVSLAGTVSSYCTSSIISFRRMDKLSQDIWSDNSAKSRRAKLEVERMLQLMKRQADVNKKNSEKIFNKIRVFLLKVEKDHRDVSALYDKFVRKSKGAEMQQLRKDLDNCRIKVESLTDEYEKAVIIASTSVTYVWVPVVGWIATVTVAGIFGAKAVKLKNQIKAAIKECGQLTKRLTCEEELVQFAKSYLDSLNGIKSSIAGVLPVFGKITGIWGAIRDDLDNILNSQLNLIDPSLPLMPFQTEIAGQLWLEVKQKADAYRTTAYIVKEKKPNTNSWY